MGNQKHPVFHGEQTSALCVSGVFVAPLLPSQMESVGYLTLILKETEGTPPKWLQLVEEKLTERSQDLLLPRLNLGFVKSSIAFFLCKMLKLTASFCKGCLVPAGAKVKRSPEMGAYILMHIFLKSMENAR